MMIASNMPAGFKRKKFGFFNMPNFNERAWLEMKQKEDANLVHIPNVHKTCKFLAADIDQGTTIGIRIQINLGYFVQIPTNIYIDV